MEEVVSEAVVEELRIRVLEQSGISSGSEHILVDKHCGIEARSQGLDVNRGSELRSSISRSKEVVELDPLECVKVLIL